MVTLIRHGQSLFNSEGKNIRDVQLSSYGTTQVNYLDFDVDLVICSTLRRARQTLDYSNIKYKDIIFTPLCREVLSGNICDIYSGEENNIESKEDIENRIISFKKMLREYADKGLKIAVISHFMFLKALTGFDFGNAQYMKFSEF